MNETQLRGEPQGRPEIRPRIPVQLLHVVVLERL